MEGFSIVKSVISTFPHELKGISTWLALFHIKPSYDPLHIQKWNSWV